MHANIDCIPIFLLYKCQSLKGGGRTESPIPSTLSTPSSQVPSSLIPVVSHQDGMNTKSGVRTDVVRIELVDAHKHGTSRSTQEPRESRAELGELTRVEVVHDKSIELDIT
jgi:hypothetical protein